MVDFSRIQRLHIGKLNLLKKQAIARIDRLQLWQARASPIEKQNHSIGKNIFPQQFFKRVHQNN
ncbi:MAG: hypothetical protein HC942_01735 [Microcoleus sp. SU_5_6]|nr:hypothetical protein [Microcoleus sp. SU_5_6]